MITHTIMIDGNEKKQMLSWWFTRLSKKISHPRIMPSPCVCVGICGYVHKHTCGGTQARLHLRQQHMHVLWGWAAQWQKSLLHSRKHNSQGWQQCFAEGWWEEASHYQRVPRQLLLYVGKHAEHVCWGLTPHCKSNQSGFKHGQFERISS